MEVDCATRWSSDDAVCEESEMIAHLQSVFWCDGDDLDFVDHPNLSSSSNSCSLVHNESSSYGTAELLNITPSVGLVNRQPDDNLPLGNGAVLVGSKRKLQPDELMSNGEANCTFPPATSSRARNKKSEKELQSRYAKKRRQRINERLRTLQELIPNGTKVDISTMLEEAVEYVKFLHLQIKLLSSDELWMYAPLAYHGINAGVHLEAQE